MITSRWLRGLIALIPVAMLAMAAVAPAAAHAQEGSIASAPVHEGGEANLQLPDLGTVSFFGGTNGRTRLGP